MAHPLQKGNNYSLGQGIIILCSAWSLLIVNFIPADKTVEIGVKSSGGGQRQEA